ncbi:hypothetical protein IJ707_06100 [bacterium]|nr:hypothetical protein [bacterium]
MLKRICLIFILLVTQQVLAADIAVKITPVQEYSTCKPVPKEGDFIDFITVEDVNGIKAGTPLTGLLTERKENGFSGEVASLYIEQFKINGKDLSGIIYQKGNQHAIYFEYFDWLVSLPIKIFNPSNSFIRGGEAFLKPNTDVYTLYLKG